MSFKGSEVFIDILLTFLKTAERFNLKQYQEVTSGKLVYP